MIDEFYKPFHKNLEEKQNRQKNLLEKLDRKCQDAEGDLVVRFGRFGKFIACSNYPQCKYTEKTAEEKKEEEENAGIMRLIRSSMIVKRGRFGSFFRRCSKYPECKNIMKDRTKSYWAQMSEM